MMSEPVVDFDSLTLLLGASSKDQIRELLVSAFEGRFDVGWPNKDATKALVAALAVDSAEEAGKLLRAVGSLVKLILHRSGTLQPSSSSSDANALKEETASRVSALFPDNFHRNLRDLLVKLVVEALPGWRRAAIEDLVGLPRLADFNWRVDVKSASNRLNRMAEPTCFVQIKVDERRRKDGQMSSRSMAVEFNQEQINNTVEALEKIKNQLQVLSSQ